MGYVPPNVPLPKHYEKVLFVVFGLLALAHVGLMAWVLFRL